ncbi:MAG: hypothetical protein ACTSYI_16340 [Promethearchaeota archaeon]
MRLLKNIIEYVIFAAFIILSLLVYFLIAEIWGIVIVVVGMVVIGGYIFITIPGMMAELKYRDLARFLRKSPMVQEDEIVSKSSLSSSYVHKGLYELSKVWVLKPLVLLTKKQYLYISTTTVNTIVKEINEAKKATNFDRNRLISKIGQSYNFPYRNQTETVVSYLLTIIENNSKLG